MENILKNYESPFEALGESGIQELCNTFYDIMDSDPQFEALRKMHAADLSPMKVKLAEYLTGWMGGPPKYLEKYGTVCMTDPHEGYWIGPEERDEWLACMTAAMDKLDIEQSIKSMLKQPLFRIADAIRNRESARTTDANIIASG